MVGGPDDLKVKGSKRENATIPSTKVRNKAGPGESLFSYSPLGTLD